MKWFFTIKIIGFYMRSLPSYSPQSNKVAERKSITLMDVVNGILLSSRAPENLWRAFVFVCCILKRIPYKDLKVTPYELLKKRTPRLAYLKVLSCLTKVGILNQRKENLGPRHWMLLLLGML